MHKICYFQIMIENWMQKIMNGVRMGCKSQSLHNFMRNLEHEFSKQ